MLQLLRPREPMYQGKALSVWLEILGTQGRRYEEYLEAKNAIEVIGTNALPQIVAMLSAEDSVFKLKLITLARSQGVIRIDFRPAWQKHRQAVFALDALGPAATPAIPQLIEVLNTGNTDARRLTVRLLGSMRAREELVMPALANALGDSDFYVRQAAIESLIRNCERPDIAVPALVARLDCTSIYEFEALTSALKEFGSSARPAIPMLMARLQDRNPAIRDKASNTIKYLDPEAAAKAGIK